MPEELDIGNAARPDQIITLPKGGAALEGLGETFSPSSSWATMGSRSEQLPPLEFGYTAFEPNRHDRMTVTGPGFPGAPNVQLVDLFGSGLPDVTEMNGTVRYWTNSAGRHSTSRAQWTTAPAGFALAQAGVRLLDANGDGRADPMVSGSTAGTSRCGSAADGAGPPFSHTAPRRASSRPGRLTDEIIAILRRSALFPYPGRLFVDRPNAAARHGRPRSVQHISPRCSDCTV